jgi:hypothetical protein
MSNDIISPFVNCKKHGETFGYFSGKRIRCKKCNTEAVVLRRQKIKLKAVEYKNGKCEICGYNKCVNAFEFHHRNPEEKDFAIGQRGHSRSWEKVKKEIDKCMLLCANCHREIHS